MKQLAFKVTPDVSSAGERIDMGSCTKPYTSLIAKQLATEFDIKPDPMLYCLDFGEQWIIDKEVLAKDTQFLNHSARIGITYKTFHQGKLGETVLVFHARTNRDAVGTYKHSLKLYLILSEIISPEQHMGDKFIKAIAYMTPSILEAAMQFDEDQDNLVLLSPGFMKHWPNEELVSKIHPF